MFPSFLSRSTRTNSERISGGDPRQQRATGGLGLRAGRAVGEARYRSEGRDGEATARAGGAVP